MLRESWLFEVGYKNLQMKVFNKTILLEILIVTIVLSVNYIDYIELRGHYRE